MALSFRHLILLAFGLITLCQAPLPAQTSAAPTKDGLAFTVYAPNESSIWDQLYYLQGAKPPVKLAFFSNGRSAPIKLSGAPKPLVFGVERVDPDTQQKTYVPVVEVAWPESTAKALVLFTASDGASPQVQAVAVNDGPKGFPLRSARLFNATGVPLLGKVAAFQGAVPPGISPAYPYEVKSEDPTKISTVPFAIAIQNPEAGARLLYDGSGDAWPFARSLIVILPPRPGSKDLELRILVDSPPPSKE
ncbi:MAG: hypothetical protein WC661_04630 [Opitutaceae bacterium]|jgi:hypothetical protein